jgi:YVTN family beta-propeller protein
VPDAELGEGPSGVAVDPGTHTIYAPNHSDGTVSVINGSTRTVTTTVPVGKDPARLAVDLGTRQVPKPQFHRCKRTHVTHRRWGDSKLGQDRVKPSRAVSQARM